MAGSSRIDLVLGLSPKGLIYRVVSRGHALRADKDSIPCALVSAQLRSFGRLVSGSVHMQVAGRLDKPGSFDLDVSEITPEGQDWYRGASDFLVKVLSDIQRDFPDQIKLTIETGRQEI